ncbi:hypothetical protein [Streptococcus sp. DD12]|uniref:hypothetical protein n=1 Tax=Streptococcus sp. DD12 TaxID=1777880 RepID=UPI00079399D0|nr:hypothetical protein [Streptococcus sp. DD12]KXT75954.1 hypothetical protein STRDD12_01066 [Streptococcus sp. DD12]
MMIDYYKGRTTDGQKLALLAPLAESLRPDASANANFILLNRLSEELNSRDAHIGLSADDTALLAHIAEAKKCFVDFSAKDAYDKALVAAYQEEAAKRQNQAFLVAQPAFQTQSPDSYQGPKKAGLLRYLGLLGTVLATSLVLVFHLNLVLLLIIALVAFILFLLYAHEEKS